jgi:hypothetical protein
MKQVYNSYDKWEDYKNGMYGVMAYRLGVIDKCVDLLSNQVLFEKTGLEMTVSWLVASQNHLTNKNSNRNSWVGQASCSFLYGATESETRKAWGLISIETKILANLTAEKIIKEYEKKYYKLYKNLGEKMLF